MKPVIPIVFATNNAYAPYLGVTLQSLIVHSSPENHYQIYVFHTNLTETHRERLLDMATDYISIEMVQLDQEMSRKKQYVTERHFSVETLFRFFIPQLLPQFDKVLYLDCDIVILEDIANLYEIPLGECILGVGALGPWKMRENWASTFSKQLGVNEEDMFNAGILIINCKQFVQQNIKDQCLKLLEEDWQREDLNFIHPDQDTLTITCQGKLVQFSEEWNYDWQLELNKHDPQWGCTKEQQEPYEALKKSAKIIHYAGGFKPWSYPELPLAEYFWKYARQTSFYEQILFQQIRMPEFLKKNGMKERRFPWRKVPLGCELVLYGGGDFGQSYVPQLLRTPLCRLVAICDQHPEHVPELGVPVITKEKLPTTSFDYIFITLQNEKIVQGVKEDLLALGVAEEKIIF